jgi:hypothetical protein
MRFRCEGGEYDTDRLTAYPTKNRAMPYIYISPDFAHVFVQMMDPVEGVTIRHAPADEVRRLAETYRLPELLRALPRPPGGATTGPAHPDGPP